MMTVSKFVLAMSVLVALAVPASAKPRVGLPAPDFIAETFDGEAVRLADLRGQVVVLNFWATWCGPCKAELPLLSVYQDRQKAAGLRVLAITTEDSVPQRRLKPLAAAVSFPLLRRLRGPYNVLGAVPTNYIIDRAGVLRYAKAAAFTLDDLNTLLVPLLRETSPREVASAR